MKKAFTFIVTAMMLTLPLINALAEEAISANAALVEAWKEKYEQEYGWVLEIYNESFALPEEHNISQEEALGIAIAEIRSRLDVDESFFEGYRPFFNFSSDEIWNISILPEIEMENAKGFVFRIDGVTGEVLNYKSSDFTINDDQSDRPKG